jgi:4-hydroxy-tetrahydrodipicolinate reductase
MEQVRVIVYGVGAMGSLMVRLLDQKPMALVVGAIDRDLAKVGRDLGDVAGVGREMHVSVAPSPSQTLDEVECDVVLLATTAFADEALPQILAILDKRRSVVSIVQELFFPLGENIQIADEIDRAASRAGVAVTSVGINPGFAMDLIPTVASYPCWEIEKVSVRRHVDFSPYGPDEMAHIGAGLTESDFRRGIVDGSIGHIGLLESAAMISHCLGLEVEELRQTKEPTITERVRVTDFVTVPPGRVSGFRQTVVGIRDRKEILDLRMLAVLDPQPDDRIDLGDHTRIVGTPNVDICIKEQISQRGGFGTAAVAVNTIPKILQSPPGFHTLAELGLPHIWSGCPNSRTVPNLLKS